ncbi:MAG: hypothetical protein ACLP9L_12205 [Thermoguttaceae bacterium]
MKRHGASDSETEGNAQVRQGFGSARRCDVGCRIAAFCVWIAFVIFFLGLAVNRGLMVPDDACHAIIAKCTACGIGYAWTGPSLDREPSEPVRFSPGVGTGPGMLLPCAAVLKVAGIHDVLPGISVVLIWASVMTTVLVLVGRETRGISLLMGTSAFCLAILLVFARHWFLWHSLFGEIPAAAYLLMGHWLLADERFSRRSSLCAGLFLGLAVQTKYLAALLCTGPCVILAIRLCTARWDWKARFLRAALCLLGCAMPTVLWETYKFSCLGYHSYIVNWQQFLDATHALTVRQPEPFSLALVQKRFTVAINEFSINLVVWAVVLVVVMYLFRKNVAQRWPCLLVGLLASSSCAFVYWGCFSMGWPRYAAMAVVLTCFALSLPIFALPRVRQQALFALIPLLVLLPAVPMASTVWQIKQYALFRPAKVRQARSHVVDAIEELKRQGPIDLVSRSPAEFYDVDFDLDGCMNFNRKMQEDPQSTTYEIPRRRIALINYCWGPYCYISFPGDEREQIELLLGETIVSVLFSEYPYELVETRGPPPAAGMPPPKPAGAFISATPNPAPAGTGAGSTVIAWDTGDDASGEVVQAMRGSPEETLSVGARGEATVTWLVAGVAYEFRLYAGPGRKRLLDSVRVTRACQ